MPTRTPAQNLPPQVQHLTQAIQNVPGVSSAEIRRVYRPDIAPSDLSLPGAFADLPAAALRRSKGGLPDESLLSLNFEISRDEMGLQGLEFLTWWARDRARSGDNIQLRALALPPMANNTKQLGTTLRFTMDWFYANPSQDMEVLLKAMDDAATSIETFADIYLQSP